MGAPAGTRRGRRRAEISEHAERVFRAHFAAGGTHVDLSVEQIITSIGVARSTFYLHFLGKGELLVATVRPAAARLREVVRPWWDGAPAERAELRSTVAAVASTYRADEALWIAATSAADHDLVVRAWRDGFVAACAADFGEHLRRCAPRSAGDGEPARTAAWTVGMLERGLQQLVGPAPEDEVPALVDALTDVLWLGVYGRSEP